MYLDLEDDNKEGGGKRGGSLMVKRRIRKQ